MITDARLTLCNREFHLTKPQVMQCMVVHAKADLYPRILAPFLTLWNFNFSTVEDVYLNMPIQIQKSLEKYLDEINHLFWNNDEDTPYDHHLLAACLPKIIEESTLYPYLESYKEQGIQLLQQAEYELGDIKGLGVSSGFLGIGFGLQGILQAGAINAGANLIDRGIQSIAQKATLEKYKKKAELLRRGDEVQQIFAKQLYDLTNTVNTFAVFAIAQTFQSPNIIEEAQSLDWNPDYPAYRKLSSDEKIDHCLSLLIRAPIRSDLYKELMQLTNGRDQSLVDYGNTYIQPGRGTNAQNEIGRAEYQAAINLPENTLEEAKRKLAAIQAAREIYTAGSDVEKEISRLQSLIEDKDTTNQLGIIKREIFSMLHDKPLDFLLTFDMLYWTDGWSTYCQESYFIQNDYQNLPSPDVIRAFAERGNGIPQLIQAEANVLQKNQPEPIALWNTWARKNCPYALMRLGLCRLYGNGIERDFVRSKHLIDRAAKMAYPPAMYILHQMSSGQFKPNYGEASKSDRGKYAASLELLGLSDVEYVRYLTFGKK